MSPPLPTDARRAVHNLSFNIRSPFQTAALSESLSCPNCRKIFSTEDHMLLLEHLEVCNQASYSKSRSRFKFQAILKSNSNPRVIYLYNLKSFSFHTYLKYILISFTENRVNVLQLQCICCATLEYKLSLQNTRVAQQM